MSLSLLDEDEPSLESPLGEKAGSLTSEVLELKVAAEDLAVLIDALPSKETAEFWSSHQACALGRFDASLAKVDAALVVGFRKKKYLLVGFVGTRSLLIYLI